MKFLLSAIAIFVAGSLIATDAQAHESRPGYLQITLLNADIVSLRFRVPATADGRLNLYPSLPGNCLETTAPTVLVTDNAYTEMSSFTCKGGLLGLAISVDGLASTLTDVLVRVRQRDGTVQVARLTPSAPSFVVEATPKAFAVAQAYWLTGVDHIFSGVDHLLFVLALLLLVPAARQLVWTITAFTAAHSLTLAAATLGLVHFPQAPVEAAIALSIAFVASELVHIGTGTPGLTQRKPWVVAFAFGLLHGLGFAGALTEVGLPEQAVPIALLFFNVGVEVGQLVFVALAMVVVALGRRIWQDTPVWASTASAYTIGTLAAFWTIERVVGFW